MILAQDNIIEWRSALSEKMYGLHGLPDFANCQTDDDWLEIYEGMSIDDAIEDEVECWD